MTMIGEELVMTDFVYPPIPERNFDWIAYTGDGECGPFGHGATEQAAIDDLREQLEERGES
jgi:hypothetical protein